MTHSNRLAALQEALRSLAASTDFAGTLASTLHLAAALIEGETALLVLFNKTTNQWFVHSSLGRPAAAHGPPAAPAHPAAAPRANQGSAAAPSRHSASRPSRPSRRPPPATSR
jgi:hypothetical protein